MSGFNLGAYGLVRVGVIGVGNIGTAHATNLAKHVAGATVSVVYDFNADRAAHVAAHLGATAVATVEELIAHPEVDAIVIASPDGLHADQALACLAAGKPTLCEKPLSPQLDQALEVIAAEVALGRRLITMGFMRRFDPGYIDLRENVEEAGTALAAHMVHRNMTTGPGQTAQMTLTNSVVHEMDISRWLFDSEIASVQVIAGRPTPLAHGGLVDPMLVIMETTSGVLIDVESFVNTQWGYEVRCEVVSSEAVCRMDDGSFVTRSRIGVQGKDMPVDWLGRFGEAYRLELQAWIDDIRRGEITGPSCWDGYAATACATAAIESFETGMRVLVSLVEKPALYS